MSSSVNKALLIALGIFGALGVVVVSLAAGFFVGRRYERKNMLNHPRIVADQLRGMMNNPNAGPGFRNNAPGLGAAIEGLRGHGIAGEVTEVKDGEGVIVLEDMAKGKLWTVRLTDDTIYREDLESEVSIDDVETGDSIMVIGDKDAEEYEITADEVIILKPPK